MRDSFEIIVQPATLARFQARDKAAASASGRVALSIATFAVSAICGVHAALAGANTRQASGIGYLCLSLVLFCCSFAFWTRARGTVGSLFIRWSMISAGALTASIGYLPSFSEAVFGTPPARQFQAACFNASEALYILAIVLFFAGVSRFVVIIDTLQALLFAVLRFNLIYSARTRDHFTTNHLFIGQLMALCLLLIAVVGCFGAGSKAELRFLRTVSWFFGLRLVAFFLANQVSYTWLHYGYCSRWDIPGTVLFAGFSLYLLYTKGADEEASDTFLSPTSPVRGMMPSFLALANLMLALFLVRAWLALAVGAIIILVVCYIARNVLLQAEAVLEKARLECRNEHLEGLAVRDPLTGIGNRRSLAQAYSNLQSSEADQRLSFLLMDIDFFKEANDRHGHLHGDQVLITLSKKLERLATAVVGSHCARFGGDEFALMLVGLSPEDASALAEELRLRFSARALAADGGTVSLSIGIMSLQSANDLPLETLIDHADKALYRAKMLGRNRVEVQPASATQG